MNCDYLPWCFLFLPVASGLSLSITTTTSPASNPYSGRKLYSAYVACKHGFVPALVSCLEEALFHSELHGRKKKKEEDGIHCLLDSNGFMY